MAPVHYSIQCKAALPVGVSRPMTKDKLKACTLKKLGELARKQGVSGWQSMKKEQLITILAASPAHGLRGPKKAAAVAKKPTVVKSKTTQVQTTAARRTSASPVAKSRRSRKAMETELPLKDLSGKPTKDLPGGFTRDRIVVMVRDPYWLHCYWELTRHSVGRAEAALGQEWHGAKPILRVLDVSSPETTSAAEAIVRDIEIHGGCNNWYVDVANPPRSFRVDIGYLSPRGRFYVLARSNVVTTPRAGITDSLDQNWADIDEKKAERLYAMSGGFETSSSNLELKQLFEERLRRPLGAPAVASFGTGSWLPGRQRKFWFQLDAELIVYGSTEPHARVTLQGEPVKLRADGTFTMRFSLPDSRQIIPAVATSADGIEERTIVLAVERNTKQLEPMIHDGNE